MKKTLLLAAVLALGASTMAFAGEGCPAGPGGFAPQHKCKPCMGKPCYKQHPPRVNLDEKLKLTEEQKAKAKEMRKQSREEMQPIMEAIKTKHEQKELIKRSTDIKTEAKLEQIEKLNNQINALRKQARDIRLKNDRDFESILTPAQKKQLDKLKAEAKKNAMDKKKSAPTKK